MKKRGTHSKSAAQHEQVSVRFKKLHRRFGMGGYSPQSQKCPGNPGP